MKRKYKKWTKEEHEFAAENYSKMSLRELSAILDRSRGCIFNHLKAAGVIAQVRKSTFWDDQKVAILRKYYHNTLSADIAAMVGSTKRSVTVKANMLGLKKDPDFMEEARKMGQFKKGHIPATKGRKMKDFLPPEAYEKILKHRFTKGHTRTPSAPIGYERPLRDGFIEVKVGYRKWRYKHRLIWEEHYHEELTNDDIILFKDGNKQNLNIDNLYKVSHAELMKTWGMNAYPSELRRLIATQTHLLKQIKKIEKNELRCDNQPHGGSDRDAEEQQRS